MFLSNKSGLFKWSILGFLLIHCCYADNDAEVGVN